MIREASVAKKGMIVFMKSAHSAHSARVLRSTRHLPLRYFRHMEGASAGARRLAAPQGKCQNPCAEDLREHNDLLMHGTLDVGGQQLNTLCLHEVGGYAWTLAEMRATAGSVCGWADCAAREAAAPSPTGRVSESTRQCGGARASATLKATAVCAGPCSL